VVGQNVVSVVQQTQSHIFGSLSGRGGLQIVVSAREPLSKPDGFFESPCHGRASALRDMEEKDGILDGFSLPYTKKTMEAAK